MNVTDKLLADTAKRMAAQIDEEIVNTIIRESCMLKGWTKAPFTTEKFLWPNHHMIPEVSAWIHQYATGDYKIFGNEFWFEHPADLTAFTLRWA